MAKNKSKISPSARHNRLELSLFKKMSLAQNRIAKADNMTRGISLLMMLLSTFIGITSATQPTIMKMLKMLLPTTLPIANCALPLMAESELMTSSGDEVPKATIVYPITRSRTPHFFATDDAPSIRQFAPYNIKTSPPINMRKSITIIKFLWLRLESSCLYRG